MTGGGGRLVEVEGFVKHYGTFEAVRGVSFSIGAGEIVGLLGPNGAGKTTILRGLTGYHFPTAGSVRIAGYDIHDNPREVRESIGYLPESAPLYEELLVSEYLSFIAGARYLEGLARQEAVERVVETCGITGVYGRPIGELSKGFRQRVGIAQAIIHSPALLILDEPTTGLDPRQIVEIRSLIDHLGSEKTVILSTHILQEVEAVCDRILILNEGLIVAEGTAEEIGQAVKGEPVHVFKVTGKSEGEIVRSLAGSADTGTVVETRGLEGGAVEVKVSGARSGEAVFDWAVSSGCKLLELYQEHMSLESVFIRLTSEGVEHE